MCAEMKINVMALAYGTAVAVCFALASISLNWLIPWRENPELLWLYSVVGRTFGFSGKAAGGFVAGWMSPEQAPLHGALVALAATAVGVVVVIGTILLPQHQLEQLANPGYWVALATSAVIGVVIGVLAAWVASLVKAQR